MFRKTTWLLFWALMLMAVSPVRAELPPLIPRTALFGNPVKASAQIAPDGDRISYIAPDDKNVLQVWIQTIGKNDAKQVTHDKRRGIRTHFWAFQPNTILNLQDNDGDENWHIFAADLITGNHRDLTPFQGVRAQLIGVDRKHPEEMLVGLNLTDRRVHDVYRVNLSTGAVVLDTKNPGDVIAWVVDPEFQIRAAQATTPDGGVEVRFRKGTKKPWAKVVQWGPNDADGAVIGFTADGDSLWMKTSLGYDTLSIVKRELSNGKETLIASELSADVSDVIYNPLNYNVQVVSFNRERLKWKVIDPAIAKDIEILTQGNRGEPSISSEDRDLKKWIVAYDSDQKPSDYYLYETETKKLTHLFNARPELAKFTLSPMRPVTIASRDGLSLVSYLTLPVGIEARSLPTVLMVHGGPWARDSWGFNAQAQWLANRGYAVLSVNYRGSAGFGKKFLHAGDREWAGKMHDDLLDAVTWTVKQGIADPKRVAIFGGSYGGYAALVGATFTPDVFACAVDIVGPSNLVTLLRSIPPYWEPMRKMFAIRVGDVDKEEDFLKSKSPLYKAEQIKIPLLIAQGANDPRVKQAESEQIVAAMRKAGKPVEYLLFPDEGHGFVRPENRLKFFAAAEAFLAKHLGGGRFEPVDVGATGSKQPR